MKNGSLPSESGHLSIITETKKHAKRKEWRNITDMPRKSTTEEFVAKAKLVHGEKYDYSKSIYTGAFNNIIIICSKHGEFLQSSDNHLHEKGCQKCAITYVTNLTRSNVNEFIKKSLDLHGKLYDYSEFKYVNNHTRGTIICPTHGKFFQAPNKHLCGCGCPKCGIERTRKLCSKGLHQFISDAEKVHGNRYDYSKVRYKNTDEKIEIICKIHGIFWQQAKNHLNGNGCKKCSKIRTANIQRKTISDFVRESNEIHNNLYDYRKFIYVNAKTKGTIVCSIHGGFAQYPYSHIAGNGCPKCNASKGELKICSILNKRSIPYQTQKTFIDCRNPLTNRKLKFDFYIPSKNLLVEYDGRQHFLVGQLGKYTMTAHDLSATQFRDSIKTEYALKNNIDLLRIPYTKLSHTEQILVLKLL